MIEDDNEENYSMNSSTKAIVNACFNAFNFDKKWFLDFKVSLHIIRNKDLLSKINELNIFNIKNTKRQTLLILGIKNISLEISSKDIKEVKKFLNINGIKTNLLSL